MKYFAFLLILACSGTLLAQTDPTTAAPAPDSRKMTLEERFQNLKTKSESYQDYKVIKAYTLDAEWKIFMDSIRANKAIWQDARKSLASQQAEIKNAQEALKKKEESMADVIFSSEHINFAGVEFSKKAFAILFIVLVAGLAMFAAFLMTKLKLMSLTVKEKTDLASETQREFEEYKHKALEKQTKLSRELQNERNKLSELRHS